MQHWLVIVRYEFMEKGQLSILEGDKRNLKNKNGERLEELAVKESEGVTQW